MKWHRTMVRIWTVVTILVIVGGIVFAFLLVSQANIGAPTPR